jgi:hypothetical protein
MKLICPHCMKSVPVADDFTGREVTCPSCGKPFDAPARYNPAVLPDPAPAPAAETETLPIPNPSPTPEPPKMTPETPPIDRPPTPPGLLPPSVPVAPTPHAVPGSQAAPLPAGYTRSRGFTISPQGVAWLPAVLLVITLICTLLAWVGIYMGSSAVYSQGPWRAMFGGINPNPELSTRLQTPRGWEGKVKSDWELMVPGLFALVIATIFALADRGLQALDPRRIPPLAKLWAWRKSIITVLAGLAFLMLLIQSLRGFGLERAVRSTVHEQFAEEREKAAGNPAALAEVEYKEDQELAKFNLERTSWLYLGLTANCLAVLAMLAHIGLERRGSKLPPRIVIQY